jgi:hypothetical protein
MGVKARQFSMKRSLFKDSSIMRQSVYSREIIASKQNEDIKMFKPEEI